jgi:hypothetical protein
MGYGQLYQPSTFLSAMEVGSISISVTAPSRQGLCLKKLKAGILYRTVFPYMANVASFLSSYRDSLSS